MTLPNKYFYRSQQLWIQDDSPLKLVLQQVLRVSWRFAGLQVRRTCYNLVPIGKQFSCDQR